MSKAKRSPLFWNEAIMNYEQSGLSKTEFCSKNNLSIHQFYYWRKKLKLRSQKELSSSNKIKFLPIKTSIEKKQISLQLNNGVKITFNDLPDPSWIASLVISIGEIHVKY